MPTDGRDRSDRAAGWKPCCLKGGNQLVWHSAYLKPVPRAEAIAPAYTSWIGSRGRSCLAERARERDKYAEAFEPSCPAPRPVNSSTI